ncbi:MAG TPA: BTAD domain-containing putative transcriptional regulator [Solirubrobacteraceae bacterium]
MQFLILGSMEVRGDRDVVTLGGIKLRGVLAVLLLHANEPVSADRLALALWGQDAAGGATKTVQAHVWRLRKALGDPDLIATTPAGYCLRVGPDELDAHRFERLVEDGRRALGGGQPEHAATLLREALSLWRGPALADLAFEPFAGAEIARLEEQRLAALEARVEADLATGRHAELVSELRRLVAVNPTRERLVAQLMLALYRCGRQTDALEVYQELRSALVSDVGLEPGRQLRELQEAILRQAVTLELSVAVPELPPELDIRAASPLVGREDELGWLRLRWERARENSGQLIVLAGARGVGKTRLAAELAESAYRRGDSVLYTSARAPAAGTIAVLDGLGSLTRATLLVLDHADAAGGDVLQQLEKHMDLLKSRPLLVLVCCEDAGRLAGISCDAVLTLKPLAQEAVRVIARRYAVGSAPMEVPAQRLLEASGGLPRRVHELASHWAQAEAERRVSVVAGRAEAERPHLHAIQDQLAGEVVELQAARERILPRRIGEPVVVCPFRGLASYDVSDAEYFCGRQRLVAELVARLVGAPLLGVVGPSGSGKSSVMRAGLLPALAGGVLPGSEDWTQVLIRPGAHPVRELASAFADLTGEDRVVLAVDQFEETFTVCGDEAERTEFVSELVHVAQERDGRFVVVIAIRGDFYGRCAAYPGLSSLLAANHVLVGPMRRDELRQAIEGPSARAGLRIESELVEALVDDVAEEPGALPLLSTALLELWQRRDGRRLNLAAYNEIGGVRGAVSRLAEGAFGQLDGNQQSVARSVLLRLVEESASGTIERRRVSLDELDTEHHANTGRVIALLTDRRLLTVSTGTVEVAHEALLREWSRLRDWIEEERGGLRLHRRLTIAAREWQCLEHDPDALYRGHRLAEAIEWQTARNPPLSKLEQEFLEASAMRLRAEQVSRRNRIRLTFIGLTSALAAITAVAIVAVYQGRQAEQQRHVAASRGFVADAVHMREALHLVNQPQISSDTTPTATFKVINHGHRVLSIPYFLVAVRSALNESRGFPLSKRVTLQPGHTYTYRASRQLPAGNYTASVAYYDGVGRHELGPSIRFNVR